MSPFTPSDAPASKPPTQEGGSYKRSFKNYIIDSRFQLKYTSFIVGVALVISFVLGAFLWGTSAEVIAQSQKVVDESRKVSEVVKMNIKDDPIYGTNPELANSFAQASTDSDNKILEQQRTLIVQQRTMLGALVGGLTLMVVLIGLLGIYFTHKVAGPIYKMKQLLGQVGDGKLTFQGRLRKGDELQDFFETFQAMVEKLRERQANEVAELDQVIADAKGYGPETLSRLVSVRNEMRGALDK